MSKFGDWFFNIEREESQTNEIEKRDIAPLTGTTVIPPRFASSYHVDPNVALTIGIVYRAVDVISTMVSSMDISVYRDVIPVIDRLPSFIKEPRLGYSMKNFVEELTWSLALHGNAYVKIYGTKTNPSLRVLKPTSVTVTEDDGVPVYWLNGKRQPEGTIGHLKNSRLPGELLGTGPIQAGSEEIRAALLLRKFQNEWFDIRSVPTGVLTSDERMTPEVAAAYAEAWTDFLESHGGTIVLGQGLSYEALRIKPAEAQFLEVQEANNKNIARLFGIPAMHILVELGGTSMTYLNLEQSNQLFMQNCLSKYMLEIEDFLSSLLPRGQRAKFDQEQLLRMNTKEQWEVKKLQSDLGYYSGAEQRKQEGKPALPKPVTPTEKVNPNKDNEESGN
jgi:HK97 family phage portal protein